MQVHYWQIYSLNPHVQMNITVSSACTGTTKRSLLQPRLNEHLYTVLHLSLQKVRQFFLLPGSAFPIELVPLLDLVHDNALTSKAWADLHNVRCAMVRYRVMAKINVQTESPANYLILCLLQVLRG
jgi:hypothetical protein